MSRAAGGRASLSEVAANAVSQENRKSLKEMEAGVGEVVHGGTAYGADGRNRTGVHGFAGSPGNDPERPSVISLEANPTLLDAVRQFDWLRVVAKW